MLAPETTKADVPDGEKSVKNAPKLLALPSRDLRTNALGNTNEEAIVARAEKIYDLRQQGKSWKTIGEELGISTATAHRDGKMILRMKYAGLIEKDETILADQNHKIDLLIEKWLPVALESFSVGETRVNKRGEEYDIQLKDWEAASAATDKLIALFNQQMRLNAVGVSGKVDRTPEEVGTSVAMSVFKAFEQMQQKPVKAEVIENDNSEGN